MLHFLLDEHVSPVVAREAKFRGLRITAFQHWQAGAFLGADDPTILIATKKDGLTLVSYDQRTLRPLLKEWAEQGTSHGGVVFVDQKTIAPQDIGSIVDALAELWGSERRADWTDRVMFLQKAT